MLCSICKGKGLCGKPCPILARFNALKSVKEDFFGSTPPAIFVGRFGYPNVFAGVLAPNYVDDNVIMLDSPEQWYQKRADIETILSYRSRMIYSRSKTNIKPNNKFIEIQQEIVQSKKPCDVEIKLKKKPELQLRFDRMAGAIPNAAQLEKIRLTENPAVPRIVDKIVSDYDLNSSEAVDLLYKRKIPVSTIQKIFSCGLLGVKTQRKLVPTRWSVTAIDDIISLKLLERIKTYPEIDEYLLFSNTYLGNHYEILLMPRHWSYELIEAKFPKSVWNFFGREIVLYNDCEGFERRKRYAQNTVGGYYSVRLPITEYLSKIKRQATALVVRECLPEYFAPLGVGILRECCRHAFDKKPLKFSSFGSALKAMKQRLKIPWHMITEKSKLLKELKEQKTLIDFS